MARGRLTGAQVRAAIERDNKNKLRRERKAFLEWWMTYNDLDESSMKAAWNSWKRRAGFK